MAKEKFGLARPTMQTTTQYLQEANQQVHTTLARLPEHAAQLNSVLQSVGSVRVAILGVGLAALCWVASTRSRLTGARRVVLVRRRR